MNTDLSLEEAALHLGIPTEVLHSWAWAKFDMPWGKTLTLAVPRDVEFPVRIIEAAPRVSDNRQPYGVWYGTP